MESCSCKNKRCGCNSDQNERKKQQMDRNSIFRKPTKPKPTKEISKGNLMSLISNSAYIRLLPRIDKVEETFIFFLGICKSSNFGSNKRCLRKDEVGNFADFMQAGDPCFLRKGNRVNIS